MHSPVNIYKNLIVILVRNTQNYISILQSLFIYIYIYIYLPMIILRLRYYNTILISNLM